MGSRSCHPGCQTGGSAGKARRDIGRERATASGASARSASDMGSASVAGLQGGRDILSPSGTSTPSSSYPKIGGQVSGSGWATASECTQTCAKRVPKTCARPFQRVQKSRAEFLSVEESLGILRSANSTVRADPKSPANKIRLFASRRRCEKPLGRSVSPRDGGSGGVRMAMVAAVGRVGGNGPAV